MNNFSQHIFSENKLEFPENATELCPCFSHIKVLFLNRMGYSWEQVSEQILGTFLGKTLPAVDKLPCFVGNFS